MNYNLYLKDEEVISDEDIIERQLLITEFEKMPKEMFAKMRHLQPQIGCLNNCSICSKFAGTTVSGWNEKRIRNVIVALKVVVSKYRSCKPFIAWDRQNHRSGVIFSYLDNDIGNYYYLYDFIKILYHELGVKTRISTVGFSRHNKALVEMHTKINSGKAVDYLAGVRLSFTPYEIGWVKGNYKSSEYSRKEYIYDMAEFLKIYKPYYKKVGSGSREMCVELRYKPLVICTDVFIRQWNGRFIIAMNNYLYISYYEHINFNESLIKDPYDHTICLTEAPHKFYNINLKKKIVSEDELEIELDNWQAYEKTIVDVYMLINAEGEYFSINPSITETGNYGINVYPKTNKRKKDGYLITERFFLNALYEYKKKCGIGIMDVWETASWEDVKDVVKICKANAKKYLDEGKYDKAKYIENEILPMINAYIEALNISGYTPKEFFDANFTIDTGIICNMGRALTEFKGLSEIPNEPLTPTHERNYGRHTSTMTQEGIAWRLSCNYNNEILIEKLNLCDTASEYGQLIENYKIKLRAADEKLDITNLKTSYLIPGQKLSL